MIPPAAQPPPSAAKQAVAAPLLAAIWLALVTAGCTAGPTAQTRAENLEPRTVPLATPQAVALIAAALGEQLVARDVSADLLHWEQTPADARLQALHRGGSAGPLVAYLHPRRGAWKATSWPQAPLPPAAQPPRPAASPKEEYGRGVVEQARVEAGRPQPAPFIGVIADALVFAGDEPDELWALGHERATGPLEAPASGLRDELAGSPRLYPGGVIEWGPFPYEVPDDAAERLLAIPQVTTAVLRAVDAHADGPRVVIIVHRPAGPGAASRRR